MIANANKRLRKCYTCQIIAIFKHAICKMYGGYFETAKISLKSSILQLAEIQVVK